MQPAYKTSVHITFLWAYIVLLGILAQIFLLIYLESNKLISEPWILVLAFIGMVLMISIGFLAERRIAKGRVDEFEQYLKDHEWEVYRGITTEKQLEAYQYLDNIGEWAMLLNGAMGIKWYAYLRKPNVLARLFEHEVITGSGKYSQVFRKTFLCWYSETKNPDDWIGYRPFLRVIRTTKLGKRFYKSDRNIVLEEFGKEFNDRFVVQGSEETAKQFLTESVRYILMSAPKDEVWVVGDRWLTCVAKGFLKGENQRFFIERMQSVVDALCT